MKQNRPLPTVIDALLAIIPSSEETIRRALNEVQDACPYTAPEAMIVRWEEVGTILHIFLPLPLKETWQKNAAAVFMGQRDCGDFL